MSYFRATLPIGAKLYSSGVILIDEYTQNDNFHMINDTFLLMQSRPNFGVILN